MPSVARRVEDRVLDSGGIRSDASLNNAGAANASAHQSAPCGCDDLMACLEAGCAWLDAHVADVNALNVFPVPDGDTGTNMSLTMHAALQEVADKRFDTVSELAHTLAHGALMGARGNSGVILSQLLRGFARGLDGKATFGPVDLATALQEGAATAYKGVMKPVEGTILTVSREAAATAVQAAEQGADFEQVLVMADMEAEASLARTPTLLAVLADAGVVDAGGKGFCLILHGALCQLRGESIASAGESSQQIQEEIHPPDGRYNYDTQFLIMGTNLDRDAIREHIATLGDSVLVVGDSSTIKVHVHCDFPGRALDYAITQGHVDDVVIENMQLQYEQFMARKQQAMGPSTGVISPVSLIETSAQPDTISVIAVASGEGLARVFESLGVSAIVPGGQTMNPSTQDLLTAIERVGADQVILLPNNGNIILAAEQAKSLAEKDVRVVPTKTIPQGIAALLALNYQADLDTNVEFMLDSSKQVQTVEITRAVRSVQVNGLSIEEGQIIGLVNGDLVVAGSQTARVVHDMIDRLDIDEYEIVTVYFGEGVSEVEANELAASLAASYPDIEVEVLDGGQAHYYFIISVE